MKQWTKEDLKALRQYCKNEQDNCFDCVNDTDEACEWISRKIFWNEQDIPVSPCRWSDKEIEMIANMLKGGKS